jgi:uncharacterized protein (AIM24 family)
MTLAVELLGTTTKMAICTLRPGQTVYSEAGKFLFCSDDVTMTTRLSATSGAGSGAGGLGGLLRGAMAAGQRMLAGESFAFTYFTTGGGSGLLGLAGVLPGEMRAIELDGRTTWFAEKDAFVAAEAGVEFSIAFSGMRNGLQGGEGFVLEKFTGVGTLLIGGSGDFVDLNPADFGGRIKVDTGCVVAWDDRISYGVTRVGGVANALFGGEGFRLATLEGDGRVILQSVTIAGLAKALEKHMKDSENRTGAGAISSIFGSSAG